MLIASLLESSQSCQSKQPKPLCPPALSADPVSVYENTTEAFDLFTWQFDGDGGVAVNSNSLRLINLALKFPQVGLLLIYSP